MKLLCTEPDCASTAKLRGLCQRHYDRARHRGDITIRPCASRGAREAFLRQHATADTNDCILWPFGLDSDGYGQMQIDGTSMTASRAMCILAHGEPPFPDAQSAHRCTAHACINPNHLRWATVVENHADKRAHGTMAEGERHGRAKLSREAALEVLRGGTSDVDAARKAGCSEANIRAIRARRTWRCLDGAAA